MRFASQELPHQWLWMVTAECMIATGGLPADRNALVAWTGREDNDYRFRELDLSTLAVLLVYALGWIGRN